MKGADFDDPRWEELLNKVTVEEFLNFASNAFHNIAAIESVGLPQYAADDGPGGSDSHYLTEGSYQGVPYADAADTTTAPGSSPPPRTSPTAGTRSLPMKRARSSWARALWC